MKFTKKTIYIGLFAILYLIVAFSSFFHACAFFALANNEWMSIILAFAFEVGQAAVLFSLLTSKKDRSRIMPWVLMVMFTLVQVIGNVYSSYKYIILNSVENLRFFKEPIFIWTELPDAQANVIIVYLVGAILPVAALLLTSMITNYLTDQSLEQTLNIEKPDESLVETPNTEQIDEPSNAKQISETPNTEQIDEPSNTEHTSETPNTEQIDEPSNAKQISETANTEQIDEPSNAEHTSETPNIEQTDEPSNAEYISEPSNTEQIDEPLNTEHTSETLNTEQIERSKRQSHFINFSK